MNYLAILKAVLLFAASNPALFRDLWNKLVALYHTAKDLADKIRKDLPGAEVPPIGDGTLQLVAASDDELDAEDQLAKAIHPEGTMGLVELGSFRKILTWAMTDPIGQALLKFLLSQAKMGS